MAVEAENRARAFTVHAKPPKHGKNRRR
jgi:hypothetical protein